MQQKMKGKKEKYDVFLSYRRAGGTDTAMLICAELRRR